MVTFVGLLQLIYEELRAIISSETSVSTPDDHVGVLNRTKDKETPFLGFEWSMNPYTQGIGNNIRSGGTTTDNNGNVQSVDRIRDYDLTIDFGVVLDGDRPRERDEMLSAVQAHFSQFVSNPCDIHDDVSRVREMQALPSGGGSPRDVGVRVTYEIRFSTADTESLPAMETIDWNLDVSGVDAYPENYN